ncbi:MAG: hypothetical protein FJ291_06185 [Planctomycetes bacterium]|nr:hypothetical protein [Planctomycetota bacterium]
MTIETLNALVSGAIWRAEQLDELGADTAASAWKEVSQLEEEIAKIVPAKEAEGRIARRGAVRAALKANDHLRARDLAERYAADNGVPRALRNELRNILRADADELSEEFPFVAKHYKPNDIRKLANRLQECGPFNLVA